MKSISQIKWKLLATYLALAAVCLGVVIAITRQLTISIYGLHVNNMRAGRMCVMMSQIVAASLIQSLRDTVNV